MIVELVVRFLAGGIVVTLFSALGELVQPKSLCGLFGGAPSVAIVTIAMAYVTHGSRYVATEASSMVIGAIAFVGCAAASVWLAQTPKMPVSLAVIAAWIRRFRMRSRTR